MPGGFSNKPKILRGAFFEYGLSLPPMVVVFQFNPVQLTRNHSVSYTAPNNAQQGAVTMQSGQTADQKAAQSTNQNQGQTIAQPLSGPDLGSFHRRKEYNDLGQLQKDQISTIMEESISLEIRLDATDKLDNGDPITSEFGILPQLSTLELMVQPKEDNLLGAALGSLLGTGKGFSFTKQPNPPMILFIWGRTRILPVNITSMNVTETEFDRHLNPIRASVSVGMTVIEGPNTPYTLSKSVKVMMSLLNLANLTNITDVIIPG